MKGLAPRRSAEVGSGARTAVSRRSVLRGLGGSSVLGLLGGCGAIEALNEPALPPPGTIGRAAFLAPLSGPQASIGRIMREAASLGGTPDGASAEVEVIDAGSTDATAVAAAQRAVASGAKMLVGPLFSGQSRAVAAAVGRAIPVVSLSNDSAIAGGNLFVFGITAEQSARAVMGFAAGRGLRRICIVVPPGEFGDRQVAAARAVAPQLGQTLGAPVVTASASGLDAQLVAASGGSMPDAVYLPVVGGVFEAQATALATTGVQILGSDQWAAIRPYRIAGLRGGWFAGPDPIGFEAFAIAMEDRVETEPGVVVGLAFDAVEMTRLLGRLGQQSRAGLLREAGFEGILGPYRFLDNGQCERGLAVLSVADGATTLIGAASA